jgi:DNA-nicking Smr family endonuclease
MEEGLFVEAFSIEKGLDKLDLHGFPLDTAKALIRCFLDRKRRSIVAASPATKGTSDSRLKLVIVTSRGNHINSDGRQGVLREEVEVFLRHELEVEVTVSPDNPGCIVVTV